MPWALARFSRMPRQIVGPTERSVLTCDRCTVNYVEWNQSKMQFVMTPQNNRRPITTPKLDQCNALTSNYWIENVNCFWSKIPIFFFIFFLNFSFFVAFSVIGRLFIVCARDQLFNSKWICKVMIGCTMQFNVITRRKSTVGQATYRMPFLFIRLLSHWVRVRPKDNWWQICYQNLTTVNEYEAHKKNNNNKCQAKRCKCREQTIGKKIAKRQKTNNNKMIRKKILF